MYDLVIVGCGLFGATYANLAHSMGQCVLIIDKRDHIGGNCHTREQENIVVHAYGPHIFHTSNVKVWNFVNKFAAFNDYTHRVKAFNEGVVYSLPINMMTLQQLFGVSNISDAKRKLNDEKVRCDNPRNLEEFALANVGHTLYEKLFYGYTKKQWGCEPADLSCDVIKRIPIRFTWDDNYFDDAHQGIPVDGYTPLIENMLEGCEVQLGVDFFNDKQTFERLGKSVLYTGKIDEYFSYSLGKLEYRTSTFDTKVLNESDYQGIAQMNYPDLDVAYTRCVEHKHFSLRSSRKDKSVVTHEYSKLADDDDVPCYPINNILQSATYERYKTLAKSSNTLFGGRLAMYKYLNMDQTILAAMKLFDATNI